MSVYPHRIFIGWDAAEAESADVLKWSLEKHSFEPLEIRFLKLQELKDVFGYDPDESRPSSTEFSYTRFLIPWLCGYQGHALFMDCDIVCLGDISPLFKHAQFLGPAISCVQHLFEPTTDTKMDGKPQKAYFRKMWSSVMLLNCRKFHEVWSKEFVEKGDPSTLHGLHGIGGDAFAQLPYKYNEVGEPQPDTVLYHYTEFNPIHNPGVHPHERLYLAARAAMRGEMNPHSIVETGPVTHAS